MIFSVHVNSEDRATGYDHLLLPLPLTPRTGGDAPEAISVKDSLALLTDLNSRVKREQTFLAVTELTDEALCYTKHAGDYVRLKCIQLGLKVLCQEPGIEIDHVLQ